MIDLLIYIAIIFGIFILIIFLSLVVISFFCFDDNDPDMDWYNSQN